MHHVAQYVKLTLIDTKPLQQNDKFYIKIAKMMEDPKSTFNERD